MSRCFALPHTFSDCLAAPLNGMGKMLLPDFCNRHSIRAPIYRSILEPAACAAETASAMHLEREPQGHAEHGVGPPCGNPAPSLEALDGASKASADKAHSPPKQGGTELRLAAALPGRGVISRDQGRPFDL